MVPIQLRLETYNTYLRFEVWGPPDRWFGFGFGTEMPFSDVQNYADWDEAPENYNREWKTRDLRQLKIGDLYQ